MAIVIDDDFDPDGEVELEPFDNFLPLLPADVDPAHYLVDIDFNDPLCYTLSGGNLTAAASKTGAATVTIVNASINIPHGATVGTAKGITLVDNQYLVINPPLSPNGSWAAILIFTPAATLPDPASGTKIGAPIIDSTTVGAANSGMGIFLTTKSGGYAFTPYVSGETVANRAAAAATSPVAPTIAIVSATASSCYCYVNGVRVYSDTTKTTPKTVQGNIRIGGYGSTYSVPGVYQRIILYNRALTEVESQRLTDGLGDLTGIVIE